MKAERFLHPKWRRNVCLWNVRAAGFLTEGIATSKTRVNSSLFDTSEAEKNRPFLLWNEESLPHAHLNGSIAEKGRDLCSGVVDEECC